MAKEYTVCRVINDVNRNVYFSPIGKITGLDNATEFNLNNYHAETDKTPFVAILPMYGYVESEYVNLVEYTTDKVIHETPRIMTSGKIFNRVKNTSRFDQPLYDLLAGETKYTFWNYNMYKDLSSMLALLESDDLVFYKDDYELTKLEATERLYYMKDRIDAAPICNDEDRLIWNQFTGNRILIAFRSELISTGFTDANDGAQLAADLADINTLLLNGQLVEAKMFINLSENEHITDAIKLKYSYYIDSCYVNDVDDII